MSFSSSKKRKIDRKLMAFSRQNVKWVGVFITCIVIVFAFHFFFYLKFKMMKLKIQTSKRLSVKTKQNKNWSFGGLFSNRVLSLSLPLPFDDISQLWLPFCWLPMRKNFKMIKTLLLFSVLMRIFFLKINERKRRTSQLGKALITFIRLV